MAVHEIFTHDLAREAALELLPELFGGAQPEELAVRLWDGSTWQPGQRRAPARVTLVLKHAGALRSMFADPSDRTLGEAYIFDDCDVEGDIEYIFTVIDRLFEGGFSLGAKLRCAVLLRRMPKAEAPRSSDRRAALSGAPHSKSRDQGAVTFHYDVSNDFYRLWLDRHMVYSCAYFHSPHDSIDQAQENKLDYICRKLRLRPGERLLDIGCGWGALIMHAARRYGAQALGITLSNPQAELARERIREAGLEDRCRVQVCDYRDLDEPEAFDKLVSVGMAEHVGGKMMGEYFRCAWRLLKPGGIFLNHAIAQNLQKPYRGESFVQRYVFPDSELVPISTALRAAEEIGWELRDLESLREHYMMTLRHWVQRLERQASKARETVGDVSYRIWRLYMAGGAHRFRTGWLNVYQSLLTKPGSGESRLPLTRADWYIG